MTKLNSNGNIGNDELGVSTIDASRAQQPQKYSIESVTETGKNLGCRNFIIGSGLAFETTQDVEEYFEKETCGVQSASHYFKIKRYGTKTTYRVIVKYESDTYSLYAKIRLFMS